MVSFKKTVKWAIPEKLAINFLLLKPFPGSFEVFAM